MADVVKFRMATLVIAPLVLGAPFTRGSSTPSRAGSTCVRRSATPPTAASWVTKYAQTIDAAARRGLAVWVEADLAKRWMQGPASFDAGIARLVELGSRPGVVGVKIADELGYQDDYQDAPECMLAFLRDARTALQRALPGRLLLVDFVVPELGCAPRLGRVRARSTACRRAARVRYPAITLAMMDRVVASGSLDTIDLSTFLAGSRTYRSWGIDQRAAQHAAWREVVRRGWTAHLKVNGRKALAHPGVFDNHGRRAESDTGLYVDAPLRDGAHAVDVWTWRQQYLGKIYRLMDPGMVPNALWSTLRARHDRGDQLLTHFSPSSVELGVENDLDVIAQVFRGVFVAAGVG